MIRESSSHFSLDCRIFLCSVVRETLPHLVHWFGLIAVSSVSTVKMVAVVSIGMLTHVCLGWQRTVQDIFAALYGQCFREWHRVRQVQEIEFVLLFSWTVSKLIMYVKWYTQTLKAHMLYTTCTCTYTNYMYHTVR